MRVLVTGASGFLGRHTVAELQRQGMDVITVGRHPPPMDTAARHVTFDLLSAADDVPYRMLMTEVRPTHLLHLAWYVEHGLYWTSPLNLRWVDATARLALAFAEAGGARFVGAGTCAEYDWSALSGLCEEQSTPLAPATLYGVTKDAARRLVAGVCREHDVSFSWGRIFLPYGTGDYEARLVPSLVQHFQGRHPAFGIGRGLVRDLVYVGDAARAFTALLTAEADGVFNIASGQPIDLTDLVFLIAKLSERDPATIIDLSYSRPGEPALLAADVSRLRGLGWRPEVTLEHGLGMLISGSVK